MWVRFPPEVLIIMPQNKKNIELDIVWFKRDLRISDNKSLEFVSKSGNQTLFVYIFEPSVIDSPDCDKRHIRFIHESIIDIQKRFKKFSIDIKCVNCEAIKFFKEISDTYKIKINDLIFNSNKSYETFKLRKGFNHIEVISPNSCNEIFTENIYISKKSLISPNPVEGKLVIYPGQNNIELRIIIFDMNGNILKNKFFNNTNLLKIELDV